ncbi:T9SS type A sorting domain-containing protein [Moheibacter lacus]|uniref:T9SS type A sorting domain-containing protein n=1 Tax=Moheibacter lacus TaxID=2745851 RepID=A0A838ZT35_9FLAO|nr:T9SS type A sorting domain-containing protein [Moheibacter lacus]MBA5630109.1 T9SS type A sorting domain-containing protein [Moheibacter lacus]
MKYLFILFLFSSINFVSAQTNSEILLNHTWRLISFDNECFGFGPIEDGEFDPNNILLTFSEESGNLSFHTEMCQSIDGTVEMNDTEINFDITNTEGEECVNPINQNYEVGFQCAMNGEYDYTITEENGFYKLLVSNDIFMGAEFTTEVLNTNDLPSNSVSIYPNPVLDKLTIENPKLEIESIKITDASGKHIFQQSANAPKIEIDFTHYPKGVYFITIESKGKTKTEKVIKK